MQQNSLCESCLLLKDCRSVCFLTECAFYYNKEKIDKCCKRWTWKHPIQTLIIAYKRRKLYKVLEAVEFRRKTCGKD